MLHQAGRWDESNDSFETAERLAEELYTRSVSQAVGSYLINDVTVSYRADPFEMALVPYYRSLNYINLGRPDEALVEARKASLQLGRFVDLAGRALDDDESWKKMRARLNNNAFLQYYSGMLYEWNGETNDAFISYRNAADAYALAADLLDLPAPPSLGEELRRTATKLGFTDEPQRLGEAYPGLLGKGPSLPAAAGGEVVLLLELGQVPRKVQQEINFPILRSDRYVDYTAWAVALEGRSAVGWSASGNVEIDYWLRVALPRLVGSRPEVRSARVTAAGTGQVAPTVVAEDIERRAFVTFDAKRPKIVLRSIIRALTKYAGKKRAEQESKLAGYLVNLLGAVVEQADTRSWTTLPNSIAIARLRLPPGTHELVLELLDGAGRPVATEHLHDVVVRADDWTFVAYRVY